MIFRTNKLLPFTCVVAVLLLQQQPASVSAQTMNGTAAPGNSSGIFAGGNLFSNSTNAPITSNSSSSGGGGGGGGVTMNNSSSGILAFGVTTQCGSNPPSCNFTSEGTDILRIEQDSSGTVVAYYMGHQCHSAYKCSGTSPPSATSDIATSDSAEFSANCSGLVSAFPHCMVTCIGSSAVADQLLSCHSFSDTSGAGNGGLLGPEINNSSSSTASSAAAWTGRYAYAMVTTTTTAALMGASWMMM